MQQSTLNDHQDSVDYMDPEVLERLYHDQDLSSRDIADRAGVSKTTILRRMDKHGINSRSRSEANRKEPHKHAPCKMGGHGYYQWINRMDDDVERVKVSRLLAVAEYGFDAVCDHVVHHKNEITWLDYPGNIELMTNGGHMRHHNLGEGSPNSKLTEDEARKVKRLAHESELTQEEIGEQFGISGMQVSSIMRGQNWSHLD